MFPDREVLHDKVKDLTKENGNSVTEDVQKVLTIT